MKKVLHFCSLIMATAMMAMCPTKMWADDVASVTINGSTTNYTTVEAAFTAANVDGQTSTVKLLANCTPAVAGQYFLKATNGTITLDLNGKSLEGSGQSAIYVNGANLTIEDSGENGTVSNGYWALHYVSGKLIIKGGTFSASSGSLSAYEATSYSDGDIVISGGKFVSYYYAIQVPYNNEPKWNLIDFQGKIVDESGNEVTIPKYDPRLQTTIIVKRNCSHTAGTGEQAHTCTLCGAVQSKITAKPEWASLTDANGNAIALNTYLWEKTVVNISGTAPEVSGKIYMGYMVTTASGSAVSVSNNSFTMGKNNVTIGTDYVDIPTEALCIEAKEDNVEITFSKLVSSYKLLYSTDGKQTWQKFNTQNLTNATLCTLANIGDKVYLAGDVTSESSADYTRFDCSGKYAVSGKLSAILGGATTIPYNGCYYLFSGDELITAPDMSNITSIGEYGCQSMFSYCEYLTTAPDMSGLTTVGNSGCSQMFFECPNITTAPDMSNVTTIGDYGFYRMFQGCSNLNYVTVGFSSWPTAEWGTASWLQGVASEGTIVCPSGIKDTYSSYDCIPSGWTMSEMQPKSFSDDMTAEEINSAVSADGVFKPITYTRNIKANWNTVCLPFAVKSTDDVKFYVIKSLTDGEITLQLAETLEAGKPALVYSTSTSTLNITGSGKLVSGPVNATGTNCLVGSFVGTTVPGANTDAYYFGLSANTGKYVKVSSNVDIKPFRAYIKCSKANGAAGLRQVIEGEDLNETAIADVVESLNDSEAQYFDMNGRKIAGLQKGMNIIKKGGKVTKVLIK